MADTAEVFESGVDYRDKFISKYGRKCNIPSVQFLDAKFHPTLPDHVIVLSSVTFSDPNVKVNLMLPSEILKNMDKKIKSNISAQFVQLIFHKLKIQKRIALHL